MTELARLQALHEAQLGQLMLLFGVIFLVAGLAIVLLWKENYRLTNENKELQADLAEADDVNLVTHTALNKLRPTERLTAFSNVNPSAN